MGFERREILLILGVIFLMVGLLPFLAPVYSIIVAVAVFVGIKMFVKMRKKHLQKIVGEGVCAVCGSKINDNKCPKCDSTLGPETADQ